MNLTSDPGTWLPQGRWTWISAVRRHSCHSYVHKWCRFRLVYFWESYCRPSVSSVASPCVRCTATTGKAPTDFQRFGKQTTVGVRWWEKANTFPQPDPVSLALPEACDGSQGADMHEGGQEQLILKVCQPTLLGYLVSDRTEDRNLQTQQHCSSHGCSPLIFGSNKVVGYRRGHEHISTDSVEINARWDETSWFSKTLQARMVL